MPPGGNVSKGGRQVDVRPQPGGRVPWASGAGKARSSLWSQEGAESKETQERNIFFKKINISISLF